MPPRQRREVLLRSCIHSYDLCPLILVEISLSLLCSYNETGCTGSEPVSLFAILISSILRYCALILALPAEKSQH